MPLHGRPARFGRSDTPIIRLEAFLDLLAQHQIGHADRRPLESLLAICLAVQSRDNRPGLAEAGNSLSVPRRPVGRTQPRTSDSTTNRGTFSTAGWPNRPAFRQGIERLLEPSRSSARRSSAARKTRPTATAACWWAGCVQERGVRVIHLRGDGRQQTEAELAAEEKFRKTKGQLNLFETEEPGRVEIYTIGFTQKSAAEFFGILRRAGIRRLIDVRLNNTSQLAGLRQARRLAVLPRANSAKPTIATSRRWRRPRRSSTPTRRSESPGKSTKPATSIC